MVKSPRSILGARLTVGQRTLTPYVEVRILCPQQKGSHLKMGTFTFIRFIKYGMGIIFPPIKIIALQLVYD